MDSVNLKGRGLIPRRSKISCGISIRLVPPFSFLTKASPLSAYSSDREYRLPILAENFFLRSSSAFAFALASSSSAFAFASASAFRLFSTSAMAFHCSNSCLAASMAALCSLAAAIFSATVAPGLGLEDSSFFKAASLSLTVLSTTERAMSSSPSVCSTIASHAVSASVCVYCGSPVCASFGMRSNADSPLSS